MCFLPSGSTAQHDLFIACLGFSTQKHSITYQHLDGAWLNVRPLQYVGPGTLSFLTDSVLLLLCHTG